LKTIYRGANALPSIELTKDDVSHAEPWLELDSLIAEADQPGLVAYLEDTSTGEKARAISRLDAERQAELFALLPNDEAAELVDEISDAQAAQLLEALPASDVAAIADHLPSDEQADLINCFDVERAEAILEHMQPDESADARRLRDYPKESAGGLMVTEFLTCKESSTVGDVLASLRDGIDEYEDFDVQYLYVVSPAGALTGVLPLRSLVLSRVEQSVADLMVRDPLFVSADTSLDELDDFFQRHAFFGVPVTDQQQRILGVVRRADVVEARAERTDEKLRRFSGLLGGEEFRTMPVYVRSLRRMIWLSLTVVLNLISASVIGLYQDTLNEVIALAVFLPVISGMGGSSGNQAIAVSIRELTLGLIKPHEIRWVMLKELSVGVINGLLLGAAIGCVAGLWKENIYLGLVVGAALALSNAIAVCAGGGLPLLLQRAGVDAALVAGPILMTLADACGFFFALSFASILLQQLV
jgi:magnesium transporter